MLAGPPMQDSDPVFGDSRLATQGARLPPAALLSHLGLAPPPDARRSGPGAGQAP